MPRRSASGVRLGQQATCAVIFAGGAPHQLAGPVTQADAHTAEFARGLLRARNQRADRLASKGVVR